MSGPGAIREVGFVGLGSIGGELAGRLRAAGYRVAGVDPEAPGADADSLGELDRELDAVCVSVPGPAELESVASACLALRARPRYFVNLTTVGPRCATAVDRRFAREAPATVFAECPVTGGVVRAREGECSLLFGSRAGEPDRELERLLGAMGRRFLVLDGVAAAATAKLVNNVAAVSIGLATLEALRLGAEAGLEVSRLLEVLEAGTGDSYILRNSLSRALRDGDLETGFRTRWALKDMRLALEQEASESAYTELATRLLERYADGPPADLSFVAGGAAELLAEDGAPGTTSPGADA